MPDYRFSTFDEVTPAFLRSIGVSALILDVDNTLEPYENPVPGEHVKSWIAEMKNAGIRLGIVSNNHGDRILLFNEEIALPLYYNGAKPFAKWVRRMMRDFGKNKGEVAMLGDQIFTDVWAARNAGIRAILVPPIRDKRDLLTRTKRLLERPILARFDRLAKSKNEKKES